MIWRSAATIVLEGHAQASEARRKTVPSRYMALFIDAPFKGYLDCPSQGLLQLDQPVQLLRQLVQLPGGLLELLRAGQVLGRHLVDVARR